MPYIDNKHRQAIDDSIDALADAILAQHSQFPEQTRDGLLNYSLTRLLNKVYANARYHDMNELIGMLECCKLEYYRKYISPYEDLKESQNGKVQRFEGAPSDKY